MHPQCAAEPRIGKPVKIRRSLTSTVSVDKGAQAIGPPKG